MSTELAETLGNLAWMTENNQVLKALLPETWTHIHNLDVLQIGSGLKLLGVDWRSDEELMKVMGFLHAVGVMQSDGLLFRAKP